MELRGYLRTAQGLQIELFNKKRYRTVNGYAKLQILYFENGKPQFYDFGKEIPINDLYDEVKLVFRENRIIAVRIARQEPLKLRKHILFRIHEEKKKKKKKKKSLPTN